MSWTTPRTWTAGELVTAAQFNTHLRDNLNALGTWLDYTPTWTGSGGNPSLGNGTLTARYARVGKTVFFEIYLAFGSSTTPGTGTWGFTLPSTASVARGVFAALILDTGTKWYVCQGYLVSTTVVNIIAEGNSGSAVGAAVPITWATGDALTVAGFYVEA